MGGPSFIHLELSSVCDKKPPGCFMCGRRKLEREHPELCNWGFMDLSMVYTFSKQIKPATVVQMHGNGEPLCYPHIGEALSMFTHCIRQFNTNGKLLLEKSMDIIDNLDVLTVSVIQNDPEADEQYRNVLEFLNIKRHRKPRMVYRILGDVDNLSRWTAMPGLIARRTLHIPDGSRNYKKPVTIPEIGICLDLLTHLAVDRFGNISLCVRFDPDGKLRLGNIDDMTLSEAWNGKKRGEYIRLHTEGKRWLCPGCDRCDFYGVPTG